MFDLNTITCPVFSADMKSTKWFTTNLYNLTQKLGNGLFKIVIFYKNLNGQQFNHIRSRPYFLALKLKYI